MTERQPRHAVYVISVFAELAGVHPQTLRNYERSGLLSPERTSGGSRRFSDEDLEALRRIQDLTNDGVNLEGVKRIMALEVELENLRERLSALADEARAEWKRPIASTDAISCRCRTRSSSSRRSAAAEEVPDGLGPSALDGEDPRGVPGRHDPGRRGRQPLRHPGAPPARLAQPVRRHRPAAARGGRARPRRDERHP